MPPFERDVFQVGDPVACTLRRRPLRCVLIPEGEARTVYTRMPAVAECGGGRGACPGLADATVGSVDDQQARGLCVLAGQAFTFRCPCRNVLNSEQWGTVHLDLHNTKIIKKDYLLCNI